MRFSFNEWLGLILSVAITLILASLAYLKILDPAMVGGAFIAWGGTIVGFFFRKRPK